MIKSTEFFLDGHVDALVMLLHPTGWGNREGDPVFELAKRFSVLIPVVIVLPDLPEGKFHFAGSDLDNIRILHVFREFGPGQSGLLSQALLSIHCIKPILWIHDGRFADFFIYRYAPIKVFYTGMDPFLMDIPAIPYGKKKEILSHAHFMVGESCPFLDGCLKSGDFHGEVIELNPVQRDILPSDWGARSISELMKSIQGNLEAPEEKKENGELLNVLILYDQRYLGDPVVKTGLESFSRFSRHRVFYANVALGQSCRLHLSDFEALLFHSSVSVLDPSSFSSSFAHALKRYCGYKLAFQPPNCECPTQDWEWISGYGVNALISAEPVNSCKSLFPGGLNKSIDFLRVPPLVNPEPVAGDVEGYSHPDMGALADLVHRFDLFITAKIKRGNGITPADNFVEIAPGGFYGDEKSGAYPVISIQTDNSTEEMSRVDVYWNMHTVFAKRFKTVEESIQNLQWRFVQYPLFAEMMDLYGRHEGEVILDYGCGPGNDLIGFLLFSGPRRIIGMDISSKALALAAARLELHQVDPERVTLIHASDNAIVIPLAENTVDYIYSGGVLHHTSDPPAILREFHRILKPGKTACIMVYNKNSLWYHLNTAYYKMIVMNAFSGLSVAEAFSRNTDGEYCPIARCYSPEEFISLCGGAGFTAKFRGGYLSQVELDLMAEYYEQALADPRLAGEHKQFLERVRCDGDGFPIYEGKFAGIGGVYHLEKKSSGSALGHE